MNEDKSAQERFFEDMLEQQKRGRYWSKVCLILMGSCTGLIVLAGTILWISVYISTNGFKK